MDDKTQTLEGMQETHSEMLATAHDLGLELPEELKADFTDMGAGAAILASIDTMIRAKTSGKKGVATDAKGEHNAPSSPKKAAAKKASKPKKSVAAKETATESSGSETEEKQQVASKTAKKTKAKKTAKKAASANSRKRVAFDEAAKIVATGKENPSSLDSGKGQRIQNVLKHNGKTVKTYLSTGKGKKGTLGWCVANGLVKVA